MRFPIEDPILSDYVNVDIPLSNFESYAKDIEEFLDNRFLETVVDREQEEEEGEDNDRYLFEEDEDDSFMRTLHSFSFFQGDKYRYGIEL